MNLEKYICDLLYRHECVIVPEFGGFITNYEPARIENATHSILPPRKYLVFNSGLSINDGLLATEISSKLNCSFDEAMQLIRREVIAWHERLKAGKTILLPGIGTFSYNKDGKLNFKPDQDQNFFNEAFGLSAMVIPPLPKQRRKPQIKPAYYHKPARKASARKIRRLAWAAAITIPLVAAGIWSFMNYDTLRLYANQHAGLFGIMKPEPLPAPDDTIAIEEAISGSDITLQPANETVIEKDEASEEDFVLDAEPSINEEELAGLSPVVAPSEAPPPSPVVSRAYHIIIGSFENTTNAQQLVDELKDLGWNAMMVESSQGMHRVSMASHINKQEALKQLYKIRDEHNPGAWLLRF